MTAATLRHATCAAPLLLDLSLCAEQQTRQSEAVTSNAGGRKVRCLSTIRQ